MADQGVGWLRSFAELITSETKLMGAASLRQILRGRVQMQITPLPRISNNRT
jgi:hypothetical protein